MNALNSNVVSSIFSLSVLFFIPSPFPPLPSASHFPHFLNPLPLGKNTYLLSNIYLIFHLYSLQYMRIQNSIVEVDRLLKSFSSFIRSYVRSWDFRFLIVLFTSHRLKTTRLIVAFKIKRKMTRNKQLISAILPNISSVFPSVERKEKKGEI